MPKIIGKKTRCFNKKWEDITKYSKIDSNWTCVKVFRLLLTLRLMEEKHFVFKQIVFEVYQCSNDICISAFTYSIIENGNDHEQYYER